METAVPFSFFLSHVSYLLLFLVTVLSFECQKFFSDTLDRDTDTRSDFSVLWRESRLVRLEGLGGKQIERRQKEMEDK